MKPKILEKIKGEPFFKRVSLNKIMDFKITNTSKAAFYVRNYFKIDNKSL